MLLDEVALAALGCQRVACTRDDQFGLGDRHADPARPGATGEACRAETDNTFRVAELGEDHPPGLRGEDVAETAAETREHQIELGVDLLAESATHVDLAAPVTHPRRLLEHRRAALLRRPARATDQQVCDRSEVSFVGLLTGPQLLTPRRFDRGGVQLDHLDVAGDEMLDQRTVIVTGGLDPDPTQRRRPRRRRAHGSVAERLRPGRSQRELERRRHDLTPQIGHHRHRFGLADIDRHQQHPGRVQTPDTGHELGLLRATNELHSHARTS